MDRKVNDLKFCPEAGCAESFCDEVSLQEDLIARSHTNQTAPKSMMDKARYSYVNKMKVTSFSSSSTDNLPCCNSVIDVDKEHNFSHSIGWVLLRRKVFHYSTKQKQLLMQIFLAEECGKKMSPDQQQLRIKLKPSEHVTSQQICSLFSRQV